MRKIFFLVIFPAILLAAGCSDNKAADSKPAAPVTPHYQTVPILAQSVQQGTARVVEREGRITGIQDYKYAPYVTEAVALASL